MRLAPNSFVGERVWSTLYFRTLNDVTQFSPLCFLKSWVAFIYFIPLQNY